MNFCNWLSILKYLENARMIMTMCGLSLALSTASLLILVISYVRLKFKLIAKEHQTQPKFPNTI
jgi:hypothetical protein